MQLSRIEIFNKNYEIVAHASIQNINYNVDYLTDIQNTVSIPKMLFSILDTVNYGDYLIINDFKREFVGVISGIDETDDYITFKFKSILTLFDTNVVIDTDLQGTGTLEKFVTNLIKENFVENDDDLQNIPDLDLNIWTTTKDWGFNFKSDKEGMHTIITNLYHNVIIRAFTKYNLVLQPKLNVSKKMLTIDIAVNQDPLIVIESNLPNVLSKKIAIKNNEQATNKLVMHSTQNYNDTIVYFLHKDGTFNKENTDRIVPVITETIGLDLEEDDDFEKVARSQAFDTFKKNQHNHLIELEILKNDSLIKYEKFRIGQNVDIIIHNKVYSTILTGYELTETVKMKFGNIRTSLTTILKRGLKDAN